MENPEEKGITLYFVVRLIILTVGLCVVTSVHVWNDNFKHNRMQDPVLTYHELQFWKET